MYLADTNVWLERLLNQDKSEEVGKFLSQTSTRHLYVTDFTFHSIAIVLTRLARPKTLIQFAQDLFVDSGVNLVTIHPAAVPDLVSVMEEYKLDFDDAYQYLAARQDSLTLVSFDGDFDRTDGGRKTPTQVLNAIGSENV